MGGRALIADFGGQHRPPCRQDLLANRRTSKNANDPQNLEMLCAGASPLVALANSLVKNEFVLDEVEQEGERGWGLA